MMKAKHSVLHHGDWDGICAACVARNHLPPDTQYQVVQYEQPVPWELVDGCHVWIFDFSYPREQMEEIIDRAESMTCIDHHATAQEALDGLDGCHFNMDHSGARLVHDYFQGNKDYPKHGKFLRGRFPKKLVDYVEDRDLWAWKLPKSQEVSAVIGSYPLTFEAWDELIARFSERGGLKTVAREGTSILRDQNTKIASLKRAAKKIAMLGHHAMVINTSLFFSELAGELAEQDGCDFGVAWFLAKDGLVQLSFRSRGDFDVSKLAQKLGGGGHKNSAGAKVKPDSAVARLLIHGPPTKSDKSVRRVLSRRLRNLVRRTR
jgi:oligoribonuclease NrnB/cAMP/cGMP phosphodiesterase (DHH superfamily)